MKLYYRKIGTGTPVILLHGLLGSSDNLWRVGKELAATHEVFIPDLRNHGKSPHDNMMNYPAMAEDLNEFIRSHRIENPVLIGHSMGGKVAMQYALEGHVPVEKLVVVDIGIKKYHLEKHFHFIKLMRETNFDSFSKRSEVESHFLAHIKDERVVFLLLKNLERQTKKRLGWRSNIEAIDENIDNILEGISSQNLYRRPVLFIKGALSDYITFEDIPAIKSVFPEMQLGVVENAGHWVHVDNFTDFLWILRDFLS